MHVYELYTYVYIYACTHVCVYISNDFLKHLRVNLGVFVSKYFSMSLLKKTFSSVTTLQSSIRELTFLQQHLT